MLELLYTAIVVVVAGAVLTVLATRAGFLLARIEHYLTYASTAIIIGVMVFICAEVLMRYVFNSPIPGHLEGSELLVPIIVFFAISYTQSKNGHVGMTVVVENLPPGVRRYAEISTLLLSVLTCSVLSYFSYKYAYNEWVIDDVTMTPPYWRVWPSAAAIPLGYMLIAMRLYLQALHLIAPDYYPQDDVVDDSHLTPSAE
jgi:TRAP-type C4-dicarboxylate transport system permease small subunit